MALNSGKILMRRGQEVNFDPNKMMPGEWAVSLDNKFVRMCFSPGVCVRMATYEAFEADMEQIREILAECQTVEEAVQRIYEDIKDVAVDVERIEAAAASALKSEENALNSANLAVQSANTATQKASEAAGSANIASTKAEQATEGANTATQKASEAAESADNVRNMSDISQSYAVGGTGTREGEDTDNAKYYNQQASSNADRAEEAAERASVVAGFGGTYTELRNKPTINDVELVGNKTLDELGIASKEALEKTDNKVNIIIEKAELNIKETAMGENIHLIDSADGKLVEFGLYGKATQDGTPTLENRVDIEVAGSDGSVEVKSCGNQLADLPDVEETTVNGLAWSCENGIVKVSGTPTETSSSQGANIYYDLPIAEGDYRVSGSTLNIAVYVVVKNADGTNKYIGDAPFTLKGTEQRCRVFCQTRGNVSGEINETVYPMLNKGITALPFEPYEETLSTIPTPNGLAGIPVTSGGNYTEQSGQQWICDEIVKYADGSGEKIQRIKKVVFDGSEDEAWNKDNRGRWISNIVKNFIKVNTVVALCNSYQVKTASQTYAKNIGIGVDGGGNICVYDSRYEESDVATWNENLSTNNVVFYYELATPIRTPLTAEEIAEIEKLSTFYPATNISNDFDCGMKVKYIVDSKNYIDNQLAIQAKLQEEALLNMLLLMPEEVQASMIENDTNNLLNESEV